MIVLLFPQSLCSTGIGWRVRGIGGGDGDHETAAAHWLVTQTMKGREDLKEAMLRLCVCACFAQLQSCCSGLNRCCSSILENLDNKEAFASQTRGYNRKRCNYQREQKANYFPWEAVCFSEGVWAADRHQPPSLAWCKSDGGDGYTLTQRCVRWFTTMQPDDLAATRN